MDNKVKLYGKVTDFEGTPLPNTFVRIQDETFYVDLANTYTDQDGNYEIILEKGLYSSIWICQDYRNSQLEYWAWNVPVFNNLCLNARVDCLKLYGINVFRIHGNTELMIYFRPMSLNKGKDYKKENSSKLGLIDVCPNFKEDDIEININDNHVTILQINKVKESAGKEQFLYSYLVQVGLNTKIDIHQYNKINISIYDNQTNERGEGCMFWKEEDTVLRVPYRITKL